MRAAQLAKPRAAVAPGLPIGEVSAPGIGARTSWRASLGAHPRGARSPPACFAAVAGGKNAAPGGGGAGINSARLDAETEELKRRPLPDGGSAPPGRALAPSAPPAAQPERALPAPLPAPFAPPLRSADAKVDLNLSKAIQQARMAKGSTQDGLAKLLNIDKKIIAEYENGKAIPNGQVIAKIEKALGTKLPRPPKK